MPPVFGPLSWVKQTLVVPGGCHWNHMLTVAGDDEGGFPPSRKSSDNHARAVEPKLLPSSMSSASLQRAFNRHATITPCRQQDRQL